MRIIINKKKKIIEEVGTDNQAVAEANVGEMDASFTFSNDTDEESNVEEQLTEETTKDTIKKPCISTSRMYMIRYE